MLICGLWMSALQRLTSSAPGSQFTGEKMQLSSIHLSKLVQHGRLTDGGAAIQAARLRLGPPPDSEAISFSRQIS
jgi:hypothetical protein